jgi:carbamoylphosphate synthase large subunit
VRNPATNRCKKALSDIPSKAADAVKETTKTAEQMNPYVVAAVAGLGVVGYGFYEWRTELASVARRGFRFIVRK